MTSQTPRRERSSSDKAQAVFVPQRPGLPGRTISAPAGGLHKLDSSKVAIEAGSKIEPPVIEEEDSMGSSGKNGVPSARAGDEVQPKPSVLQDPGKRIDSNRDALCRPRRSRTFPSLPLPLLAKTK